MSRLQVAPIVEGQGEVNSLRILLHRIWTELLGGEYIKVHPPIRQNRSTLASGGRIQTSAVERIVQIADSKIKVDSNIMGDPALILILLDADHDCPARLGPRLLESAKSALPHRDIACVLINVEYETWFVAAAESLSEYLNLKDGKLPEHPEKTRQGKAWVKNRFRGDYKEASHQPALTRAMNLENCRQRSPSFDKLCRDMGKRIAG